MPNFDIVKNVDVKRTFRTEAIKGMFDLNVSKIEERFVGNIDLTNDWNVGLIYGASGTGKSTIAKQLFPDFYFSDFEYSDKSVIDEMPSHCDLKIITKTFASVGFASIPSWLKPYSVLSNGEKMRVDLARCLLDKKDFIVFDEFTSVVDRQVAKFASHCVQKVVRKANKKFIAVACHSDIIEWLEPDWVFCTDNMTFEFSKKKDQKLKLKFANVQENFGRILKSITI